MIKNLETQSPFLQKILSSQRNFFCLLAAIILLLPLLFNAWQGKPLLMGEESYYHLVAGQELSWQNWQSFPAYLLSLSGLREITPAIFPILGVITIFLLFNLLKTETFSPEFSFIGLLLLVLSPTFIYSYSTISVYALSFFFLLLGVWCWSGKGKWKYCSIIPFLLITTSDFLSGTVLLLFLFYYLKDRSHSQERKTMMIVLLVSMIIQLLFFNLPAIIGPFHVADRTRDVISDFGGNSGLGIFLVLLALPGFLTVWKQRKNIFTYGLFLISLGGYIYNTEAILPLTLVLIYFATIGFFAIFERKWEITSIQRFTAFIILLGVLFSTLTYLNRITEFGPTAVDKEALTWIKENTAPETVIFSDLEESYFVQFFAQRKVLLTPEKSTSPAVEDYQGILKAVYIEQLFPLLEKNDISLLYISPKLRKTLPVDQGMLFLLQNERFKLVHSYEDAEVWQFRKDDSAH